MGSIMQRSSNTKKHVKILIVLLFSHIISTILLIFSPGFAYSQNHDFTRAIVVENDWPPYYFGGSNGSHPGFAKELIKLCSPEGAIEPVFEFYPVKRMYSYLKKGEIDIAIFSYKKSREEFVVYGNEPIFTSGYRPIVLKESNITIKSLEDFDSLRLGHLAGLVYSPDYFEYIKKRMAENSLVTTTVGNASLRMLLEGIIDVFVDTSDTVLWRAKQAGSLEKNQSS